MHHDIQNFSQIMDIDTINKLVIRYEFKIHRNVFFDFYINDILFTNSSDEVNFNLTDTLNFSIKNIMGDGAIEIVNISINEFEILPRYLQNANPPTNWIENIDSWSFEMSKPFYSYIQEVTGQGEIF